MNRAVALIEFWAGCKATRSAIIESEPWGYDSASPFLNIGLAIEVTTGPEHTLNALLSIQDSISTASHRDKNGQYVDRIVDIDLIACDDAVIDTGRLILPHPRMHLREFVLLPMIEIAPEWRHPLSGLTPAQLLDKLRNHHV